MIKAKSKEGNERRREKRNPAQCHSQINSRNIACHHSIKAPVPVAPHTLPSTRAPVRNRRHAPSAASVGTEIDPSNLPAQSAILVVVGRRGFAIVPTHLTASRRTLVETARVVLGVRVRDGGHRSRRRGVEVGTLTQGLCRAVGGAGRRGLVHAVASWRCGLLLRDGICWRGGNSGGLAPEVDDGIVGESGAWAAGLAARAEVPVTSEAVCFVRGFLFGLGRP